MTDEIAALHDRLAATGYPSEAIIGRRATEFMPDEDARIVRANFAALIGGRATHRARFRIRHRSLDRLVWLESNAALLRDGPGGAVTGVIDVVREITEQKDQEDALAAARQAAEQAMRSKADFLANMSHELRTPLNSIIGFSRLLNESDTMDADNRRHVALLFRAGQALHGVIENVLDYSKLDAAALSLDCAPFDLPGFVAETVALMEPQSAAKKLRIVVATDPDLPRYVLGDAGRLQQVMLNLLSNAVKFTSHGAVTASCALVRRVDDVAHLRVEIADTGVGIAPHKLVRLFKRFAQVGPEVATRYGGTGLGLEISRQLIELMGGTVQVTSTIGHGSTFWFEVALPVADPPAVAQTVIAPPLMLAGARILVADDVDLNRDLMQAVLARFGCRVDVASDGAEAVAMVRGTRYDLVLMDCQMPVVDGFAATRAIRAADMASRAVPIVALTASTQPEHLARCKAAGMDEHLTKPVDPVLLEQVLRRFVAPAASSAASSDACPQSPAPPAPSLAERYAERKRATLALIGAMVEADRFGDAEILEAAAIVHKLAGVAGMSGEADLGATASALEDGLSVWTPDERPEAIRHAYQALRRAA